jgi:5-methylcytosine-specific restriction endonuclease McrA
MGKEKDLFIKIWKERKRECFVCGIPLGIVPRAHFFSHVLSKGAYPSFKLNPENIVLKCIACHEKWETASVKDDPNFREFLELKEELKSKYYVSTKKINYTPDDR